VSDQTPEMNVDPSYLHDLGRAQRTAATALAGCTSDTSFTHEIWVTHGLYFGAGNQGIEDAVNARKKAGEAMSTYSNALADQLDKASAVYARVDRQQAADLNARLRDRH